MRLHRPFLLIALVALTTTLPVRAQSLRDPAWEALLENDRHAELENQARQRLKAEPGDPQATLALGFAVLAEARPATVDATVPLVEACIARHPEAAECHYMLGNLLGVQALRGGMLKGMSLAGRIRESFQKAVDLGPDVFNHRIGLMQFYLAAPGIAGGGVDKARELARATEARQPEQARCLRALVEIGEEHYAEAEKLLWAVQPGNDNALRSTVYASLAQLGAQKLNAKQPAQAQSLFERLVQADPSRAFAVYGLGRVKAETGAPQEAIRYYAQARALRGQAGLPIDYREALAWLLLGDTAKARALLQRFVAAGRGHPKNVEDAKERLAKLG
ncbi:tetratricopeptide repeat protein [Ideonella sp. YS5]|uniref:tetratricopeptide repeat protein n=1 Tax=Ideonella sp. YS5 TaxID=3453714 RepID=UPI003EF0872C